MKKLITILFLIVTILTSLSWAAKSLLLTRPHEYKFLYPVYFGNRVQIPADNLTTVEGVELGRMLFYETALSVNNKISCASCHRQQYAFSDNKDFSPGVDGVLQSRNTMALVNLLWVRNFFWDGRTKGLENQVDSPLVKIHEMGQPLSESVRKLTQKGSYLSKFQAAFGDGGITPERIRKAIAQFERTLISANSKYDLYLQGKYQPTTSELNGIRLFYTNPNPRDHIRGASCGHCHGGPQTYEELFHNNGLDSVYADLGRAAFTGQDYDKGRFRVVSLRNIALTAPYMHDSRFQTLEQVVDHYSEHVVKSPQLSGFLDNNSNEAGGSQLKLTASEKRDIIAFLNMLTDSTFIQDKRFSNPFEE